MKGFVVVRERRFDVVNLTSCLMMLWKD